MTRILHCFADDGVESECLSDFGDVIRIGLDPSDKNDSMPIQADAHNLPFSEDTEFDLGLLHPPCGRYSPLSHTKGGDNEEWPNLIPLAREIADKYCKDWIIENKPKAPLWNQTNLNGRMFGLDVEYERAFETSFPVETPPAQDRLGRTEGQPFFDSEHSKEWWAAAKGYKPNYPKGHLSRNCLPRQYVLHLLRCWIDARDTVDRPDYSNYDTEMDAQRAKQTNSDLTEWQ